MRNKLYIPTFVLILTLLFTACGGGSGGESPGETPGETPVEAGEKLFFQSVIGSQPGCITCHSDIEGEAVVGPALIGIGSRASEEYLRESILDPNAVLVPGYPSGTMPAVWANQLSDEQLDQLVAYLLSLK